MSAAHSHTHTHNRFTALWNLSGKTHSVFKYYSEYPPAAATHDRSLLRNDTIALSMNACGKSFHIVRKAVFSAR